MFGVNFRTLFFVFLFFFLFQIWCQRLLDWPIAVLSLISEPVGLEGRQQAAAGRQTARGAVLL